ncbi:hypothetical protein COCCADRAFT_105405 [Bipolaris zeicola 26-R-13]|uniref:Zn(2)-C6 fungal-type domain-containing protein n=1 Tax=Cochliobolus carbonum (strain 26-R-13) TaxID=930089 RepID=W6XX84_COCC2|nr:uncharacterized protein COCCADRAFT_105405 [Bipolaris zeicola 26-R-13]EUC29850.1 hypothetical protein COCCADRAFT_105405 [Bipolaris zeicola 26-R-13]
MPASSTGPPKPRKPRPSRARGLRTTTGCLTCRRRRVKCDELRPRCATCTKSDRECVYSSSKDVLADTASTVSGSVQSTSPAHEDASSSAAFSPASTAFSPGSAASARRPLPREIDPQVWQASPELLFESPSTVINSLPSPNSAPLAYYDLLAEDAMNNIDKYNLNLDLERTAMSRAQSPEAATPNVDPQLGQQDQTAESDSQMQEQWNSTEVIPITDGELVLFRHYVNVIGPILDLSDPSKQFTTVVPALAVHNVGLLKSLLAVAARHMALLSEPQLHQLSLQDHAPNPESTSANLRNPLLQVATQYYYETLHYLSKNLFYPSYSKSREIISTSILISTYEMWDSEGQYSNGAWERHLRGIFWIQRSQNNNGECRDPLRRAAWWQWLRQDSWVAFREGRRVLTIWRPTKRLMDLNPDELALRIVYICGRCIDFAATEKKYDINTRIEQAGKLLQALEDWHKALPSSFQPIYRGPPLRSGESFTPIWIHPPSFAAAIQSFHVGRILVLINQPSIGGIDEFRVRQRALDESVEVICGIALSHQSKDMSSAMCNIQAIYTAGISVQDPVKQTAIMHLLEQTLDITRFPPKTLLADLAKYWSTES